MKIKFLLPSVLVCIQVASGQILTWSPVFVTEEDSVIIIYDAAQGSAGLQGYTGDVYAHTGVITSVSIASGDWKHVKTNWGQNTPETKLERIGSDLYRFKIKPSIEEYYGILPTEQVLELAFVFRSANSPFKEGKTEAGGDIFLPLRSGITILSPSERPFFTNLNDTITVVAVSASETKFMKLYVDADLVYTVENDTLQYHFVADEYGKTYVKIVAENELGFFAADSFYYFVNTPLVTEPLPEGIIDGINYVDDTTVTFSLFTPNKKFAYVIGDFNDWEIDPAYYMKRVPEGSRYWLTITGLEPQKEYIFQYFVDGAIRIADPYTEKISDPWNDKWISEDTYPDLISYPAGKTTEISSILQTAQEPYPWEVTDFQRPEPQDLVIYELLIRDFIAEHDYKTLIDTLGYFEKLGVNAIELMPVNEFEGNESWGYNPSFYFAPDKYYGPKNDLKRFIDEAHKRGIAVILDVVLNHAYGQCPLVRLYINDMNKNPWFNQKAPHTDFSWGFDFNHERQTTKDFVDRFFSYWLSEYRVDGFRLDFTRGFTNKFGSSGPRDESRIDILKSIYDVICSIDSTTFVILEHLVDDNSELKELAEYGMMLWGNMSHDYQEAAMGYASNLSWGSYKTRGWSVPHLVTYMESHDEERLMYKNLQWGNSDGNYNVKELNTALQRIKLVSAFFLTIPGPKMVWQFGELGYDYSINYNGRLGNKPIRWDYFDDIPRKNLYKTIKALINLKKNYDTFRTKDFKLSVSGYAKSINLNHQSMDVTIIGNFSVVTRTETPNFQKTGEWYDYFSGDTLLVTDTQEPISLAPGEFFIYSDVKLEIPDIETGLNENSDMDLRKFELKQNYPNPFNPQTSVQYNLAHTGDVNLNVYNIVGQKVRTLVNGTQAFGEHKVIWDGMSNDGRLTPGGLYFYRLQAGDFVQTRKMLLIK